jgi:hypothetical protein
MSNFLRLAQILGVAGAMVSCNQADGTRSKQSVTVQLPPARSFMPEPGFSLATDPASGPNAGKIEANSPSRS